MTATKNFKKENRILKKKIQLLILIIFQLTLLLKLNKEFIKNEINILFIKKKVTLLLSVLRQI